MPRSSRRRTSGSSTSMHRPIPRSSDLSTDVLSTATIQELSALTVKTIWRHLAARCLPTSGTKPTLTRCLFNGIHSENSTASSSTNPTQNTVTYSSTPSLSPQVTPPPTTYTSSQPIDTADRMRKYQLCSNFYHKRCKMVLPLNKHLQPPCPGNRRTVHPHLSRLHSNTAGQPQPNQYQGPLPVFKCPTRMHCLQRHPYRLMSVLLRPILQTQYYHSLSHQFLLRCSSAF